MDTQGDVAGGEGLPPKWSGSGVDFEALEPMCCEEHEGAADEGACAAVERFAEQDAQQRAIEAGDDPADVLRGDDDDEEPAPPLGPNRGHGHVWRRPDGMQARCGGPGICTVCARDLTAWRAGAVAR